MRQVVPRPAAAMVGLSDVDITSDVDIHSDVDTHFCVNVYFDVELSGSWTVRPSREEWSTDVEV